ncbi:glycosyl transferase family 2 protein [Nitzschia inconspicua]|uniref:Glycosyl transferase family 2 protein n=1 Tax=Nitzschia inconspicua TaxID=303405 RepID=A0A9K3PZP1_9STRA|nr:glycosyl transferase family 2 protein [Nitzschia inconspicua]
MDDNHRLTEWLAYHYHVLPLRTLLVAVDPRSKTSPTKVLNRWRRMGLYIEEWNDQQFLKPEIANNIIPDDAELQIKRDRHRIRQKNFYRKCLETFKRMERTWVTLIDTDEFLMYNHRAERYEEWEQHQQEIHTARRYKGRRIALSQPPPSPADPGGMIRYLHREQVAGHPYFQPPCISCPRLQFGAKESTRDEAYHKVPPPILPTADRLDTLRYRRHAERQDFVKNGLSKSILDVSRIDKFPRIQSLHRPIKEICSAPWKDEWSSGLRINHYLGSWEAYSFRDDSRRGGERSYEGWVFKAMDAEETDDNIRPWIRGFVKTHGPDKSKELLQGSGLPPRGYQAAASNPNNNNNYYYSNTLNWTILFLDEILGVNETKGNDNRVAFDSFVRDFHLRKNQSLEGIL